MADIQVSLHGNRFGLSSDNALIAQNPTTGAAVVLAAPKGAGGLPTTAALVGSPTTVSGMSCSVALSGNIATLDFTFTAVSVTVTDAAGSGSSGSLKIFDFVEQVIQPLASRQRWTAFAEGAALTGGAGDAAFVIGFGSVAANAGDGALTGTEVDIAAATATITLSGGTATATKISGDGTAVDGSGTAADLYLNWSGSAATIDANSTISVTGTVTIVLALLGDH